MSHDLLEQGAGVAGRAGTAGVETTRPGWGGGPRGRVTAHSRTRPGQMRRPRLREWGGHEENRRRPESRTQCRAGAAGPSSWASGPRAEGHTGDAAGSPGGQGGCHAERGATPGPPPLSWPQFPNQPRGGHLRRDEEGSPWSRESAVARTRPRSRARTSITAGNVSSASRTSREFGRRQRPARSASLRNRIIAGCHAVTLDRPSAPPR